MMLRLIYIKQMKKHWFCLTSLLLVLTNILLFFVAWKFDASHKRVVTSEFERRLLEVDQFFKFDEFTLDSTGTYLIYKMENYKVQKVNISDITLLTHFSLRNLANLPRLIKCWEGPVSVAVFVDVLKDFVSILKQFAVCNFDFVSRIAFHIVKPLDLPNLKDVHLMKEIDLLLSSDPLSFCEKFEQALNDLQNYTKNFQPPVVYPSNVLRNIAMEGGETKYILSIDIDMLPSKNLRKLFNKFIQEQQHHGHNAPEKTVYVLPSFEIQSWYHHARCNDFPIKKKDLMLLMDRYVQPLHKEICQHCQNKTNYKKWFSLKSIENSLNVGYTVQWEHTYEPFYISLRKVTPVFDERFTHYGYSRLSQSCEFHVAGFQFVIMDSAFLLNVGFNNYEDSVLRKHDYNEISLNSRRYQDFKKHLARKYPTSDRHCDISPTSEI